MMHIKSKHPEHIPADGMSLLGMGFSITGTDDCPNVSEQLPVDDGPSGPDLSSVDVALPPPSPSRGRLANAHVEATTATVERGLVMGPEFWRVHTRSLDGVIKSNSIT